VTDETLLECRGLATGYAGMPVVRDLELRVDAGEVVALIGSNGAGKTTTLLTLAGELPPIAGEVFFRGESTTASLSRRARRGLGLVTEERSVFMRLTTADNLKVAGVSRDDAVELFPELAPLMKRTAGLLSGGEQQILTLARALARRPAVLLVDELSLGLAPQVVSRLLESVRRAASEHSIAVLLVEQHVRTALSVADRVYVMQRGRIALDGAVDEIRDRIDEVTQAYLAGGRDHDVALTT